MEHYGNGIAKGMAVTIKHLFRHPVTTQYPEQKLIVSRRSRGNELIWQRDQCSGCSTCAKTCPQGVIKIETSKSESLQAPCTLACPAHVNVPLYIRYIEEGKPAEALAVIREKIPFPSVCGKVCFHPCELKCQRAQIDEPVSIRVLKNFAASHDSGIWRDKTNIAPSTGKKIAVVGSGPAGLTAAYYLTRLGHKVIVFEALTVVGGMMRVGIPDYRLPPDILQREIDEIAAIGVEIKTGSRIESLDELFAQGYDAIYVAVGAHEGLKMGVEGEELPGVIDSATFLRDHNLGKKLRVGNRVAVVGGGNVAVDAARVSRRIGAVEVTILYRRTRTEMPANAEEVEASLEEGIKIEYLTSINKIMQKDGELLVECMRGRLGEPDAKGRRSPYPIKGTEFITAYDTVISAIGQRPVIPKAFNLKSGKGGIIEAIKDTLATNREGIFAGGDAHTGPASVIEAIAAGRQGAISIDKYLGGRGIIDEILVPHRNGLSPINRTDKKIHRVHPDNLDIEGRTRTFSEVEQPLTDEIAVREANRCLKCDLAYTVDKIEADMGYCIFCGLCVEACPRDSLFLSYEYEKARYKREDLMMDENRLLIDSKTPKTRSGFCRPKFEIELPKQTLLLDRDKKNNGT